MAGVKMDYVKSLPGILKIIEFVFLLHAFSCMADCCGNGSGRYAFFLAMTIIAWIMVIIIFLVFFLDQTSAIPQLNWQYVVLFSSIAWAVLLLICSALMADVSSDTRHYRDWQGYGIRNYYVKWWDTMTAGVVFGFLAMLVFIIDAVVHAKGVSFSGGGGGGGKAGQPTPA
ncbi:uncharacterized protein LOC5518013 [Nematostella vectensis]|uniref:uncharacterized protein LOC5518013 n=1 Tax=Nematostella vectensis TaxID=45351 RepID=UPI0020778432|nr:uncharacterized protein LOC5518013 [Nematostella vectensis]XP_032218486.2 uncharacterized protein LOC5518013 [Nematostella vectensis]